MGELLLEIFEQGGTAQDGLSALQNLELSVVLDPTSATARKALLSLYGRIGAWTRALHHSVMLLNIVNPEPTGRVAKQAWAAQKPAEDDVEGLMRRFVRDRETGQGPVRPEGEGVSRTLGLFKEFRGYKVAAVVASNGALWGTLMNEPMDSDSLARSFNGLTNAAVECCSRMSIGGFVTAQIEGPGGAAYLKALPPQGRPADEAAGKPSATVFVLAADSAGRREILARLAQI